MRTKYKPWAKPYYLEHSEISVPVEQISSLEDIYLEIGSGKGQFLVDIAKHNPSKFFLGVERNITCVGFASKKLVEEEIKNAKIIFIDGDILLNELKDGSVRVLFLNFSDPWPKKRHERRRLTSPSFLEKYYRVLSKDGEIRFKTDNDDLYLFSKEMFNNEKFSIVKDEEDYQISDDDYLTEYEIKKRNAGMKIHRLIIRKK